MSLEEKGNLATNVVRFFTLLLITAGIMAGMGSFLLLGGERFLIVIIAVTLACLVLLGLILNTITRCVSETARLFAMGIFVAGIVFGYAVPLLTGNDGIIGMMVLLWTVVLVYGIWIFRPSGV